MHVIVQLIPEGFALTGRFAAVILQSAPLMAAGLSIPGNWTLSPILTALVVCALASTFWALKEKARADALQSSLRSDQTQTRAAQFLRDGLLHQARDAILVWGPDAKVTLDFCGAGNLLNSCLAGPDAVTVAMPLARLRENGVAFALSVRDGDGRAIALRGCPIGDHAALYLHAEELRVASVEPENQGFLSASGVASPDLALKTDVAFDYSERELAASAHAVHDEESDDGLRQDIELCTEALQKMTIAAAVFGADQRLAFYNRSYAQLWSLDENWLNAHPTAGQILDRLRDLRRLPEQHDFAAWKAGRLKLLDRGGPVRNEFWYLPDGKTVQAVTHPRPSGGVIVLLEDVSERLGLESAYNALVKVQRATLDTLDDSFAVFGPDGRLKLHNTAFAKQWKLCEEELCNEPHLNRIAETCARRFGRDRIWAMLSLGVTAESAEPHAEWCNLERSDGIVMSLSLTRMPDGSTLAHFAEVTDLRRLQSALREVPAAAVA